MFADKQNFALRAHCGHTAGKAFPLMYCSHIPSTFAFGKFIPTSPGDGCLVLVSIVFFLTTSGFLFVFVCV